MQLEYQDPVATSIKHKSAIDIETRTIYIYDGIDDDECLKIGYYLDRFVRIDSQLGGEKKPINLYINSPGGSIYSSMLVIGRIEYLQDKLGYEIHALGEGIIASAALDILLVCKKRRAWKTSSFLYHSGSTMAMGTMASVTNQANEANRLWKMGCELAKRHTKVTDEWLDEIYKTSIDFFMDSEKALELGFIDEIL